MAGTTETVAFDIRVTGDQPAAQKLDRVSGAFKKLESGGGNANKSLQQAGERIAKISALAATADPAIGKLTGTIGKAAGAASTLSLAIGGPTGIAVGGLVAAFSIWSDYTEKQRAKLEELNKAMLESITAALTFEERLSAVTKARGQMELQKRLGSGAASSDEYEAKIRELGEQLRREQAQNPGAVSALERGYQRDINEYRQRQENARAREQIEAALQSGGNKTGAIGEEPGKGTPFKSDQSAARNQLEALRAAGEQRKELYDSQLSALEDVRKQYEMRERESTRLMLDEKKKAIDEEFEAARAAADRRIEIRKYEAEEYAKLEEAAAERRKLGQEIAISGARNVAGAVTSASVKIANGQKVTTKAFLAAIGEQAIADGTFRILQGAGMLATLNPAGAAAIAAGGAEVAFGVALGGGSGGNKGGGHGGGVGGGGYSSRGSEPSRVQRDEGPRETRSNIVVQVQTLVADERVGEHVMNGIDMAHRKLGRKLAPSIIGRA